MCHILRARRDLLAWSADHRHMSLPLRKRLIICSCCVDAAVARAFVHIKAPTCFLSSSWEAMLRAETLAALDDDDDGDETPHPPLLRTLVGANTNPCLR